MLNKIFSLYDTLPLSRRTFVSSGERMESILRHIDTMTLLSSRNGSTDPALMMEYEKIFLNKIRKNI